MLRRSKRGLLLVGTLPPPSGGIGVHILDLGSTLAAAGTKVRYLDVRPGSSRAATGGGRLLLSLAAAGARRDLLHVHTNGHNAGSWKLARIVGAFGRGRALLTLHSGLLPDHVLASPSSSRACVAACAAYAHIVCVSHEIESALRSVGVPAHKLVVSPAFSSLLLPTPLSPAGLATVRRQHPVLLCATLSRGAEYGAGVLLAAFGLLHRSIPDAGLIIYGPAARDPALDAAVKASGLSGIHRYGDLSRAEALGVQSGCDVFVRPTLTDGDALSIREALALGVRVVASDAAVRPEGTVLCAGDASALAAAVIAALDSPAAPPRSSDALSPVLALYAAADVYAHVDAEDQGAAI